VIQGRSENTWRGNARETTDFGLKLGNFTKNPFEFENKMDTIWRKENTEEWFGSPILTERSKEDTRLAPSDSARRRRVPGLVEVSFRKDDLLNAS
jgi:hypothetical protein